MNTFKIILLITAAFFLSSCGGKKASPSTDEADSTAQTNIPQFNADSALQSIRIQCAFGPRILESAAHENCGQYISNAFKQCGCEVTLQKTTFTLYDGTRQSGYNIIAAFNPKATKRIVLSAHWDSRPWADQDANPANHHTPIDAANDGASGVAVMLEVARILQSHPLNYGVDFICFDAEDAGTPEWAEKKGENDESTWCLGSQYWARNIHAQGTQYGILLDMVGGQGAVFYQEGFSLRYASNVVSKLWDAAAKAGYSDIFPKQTGGMITDDHLPMNQTAHIPTADIVPYYPTATNSFGPTWHTTQDNADNISQITLKAVGQTLLQLLFSESL